MDIQTVKQGIANMSATQVAKTVIRNLIKYTFLCVVLCVVINVGMIIWQRRYFAEQRRIWPVIIFVFLLVFPFLYLREIKNLAIVDTVRFLWSNYRDDIVNIIVDKGIVMGQKRGAALSNLSPIQWLKSLRAQFPRITQRVINYFFEEYPLIQKLPEAFSGVDMTNPDTGAIKQTILTKLSPYTGSSQPQPKFGNGLWITLARNIGLWVVVYLLLHYHI